MKNKIKNSKGFTLVELLIVIALIAILSVAVLATINPIEQSNKARDAKVQNDAAEVLSGYERYYASQNRYPWMVYDQNVTVDTLVAVRSNQVGGGLCTAPGAASVNAACSVATNPGELVNTDELKSSFLNKGYTNLTADATTRLNLLYVYKEAIGAGGNGGNNIYVCYVPKAKANRKNTAQFKLNDLAVTAASGYVPTQHDIITLDTDARIAAATYADVMTSLFRCVPE